MQNPDNTRPNIDSDYGEYDPTDKHLKVYQQIANLIDDIIVEPLPGYMRPEVAEKLSEKDLVVSGLFHFYTIPRSIASNYSLPIKNFLKIDHSWSKDDRTTELYGISLDSIYGDPWKGGATITNQYWLYLPQDHHNFAQLIASDAIIHSSGESYSVISETPEHYQATERAEYELLEQIKDFDGKRRSGSLRENNTFYIQN